MTIERLLKELGERHFEVLWRYEVLTNLNKFYRYSDG